MLLRFPIGIATFTIAVTLISTAGMLLVAPVLAGFGVPAGLTFGDRQVGDSVAEAVLLVPIGIAILLVTPAVINAMGRASRALAGALLCRVSGEELKLATARALVRSDEADAFALMRDLELYFGKGPHLTPTRLEATLLALEQNGLVTASRGSARTRYSLSESGRAALSHT